MDLRQNIDLFQIYITIQKTIVPEDALNLFSIKSSPPSYEPALETEHHLMLKNPQ